jgi:hypothetical protein
MQSAGVPRNVGCFQTWLRGKFWDTERSASHLLTRRSCMELPHGALKENRILNCQASPA